MKYKFKLLVPLMYQDVQIDSDEVELSENEMALIRRLVKESRSRRYGLMSILEDGAPELYDKLWEAIERPLLETVLEDGRRNGSVGKDEGEEAVEMDCVAYVCMIPEWV